MKVVQIMIFYLLFSGLCKYNFMALKKYSTILNENINTVLIYFLLI